MINLIELKFGMNMSLVSYKLNLLKHLYLNIYKYLKKI